LGLADSEGTKGRQGKLSLFLQLPNDGVHHIPCDSGSQTAVQLGGVLEHRCDECFGHEYQLLVFRSHIAGMLEGLASRGLKFNRVSTMRKRRNQESASAAAGR